MKVELIELQPKLEEAKVENASMMKVELSKYSFLAFNVSTCLVSLMCDSQKVGVELRFLSSILVYRSFQYSETGYLYPENREKNVILYIKYILWIYNRCLHAEGC